MQLDAEQRRALDQGLPVPVLIDHTECVMIRRDVYEQAPNKSKSGKALAALEFDRFPERAERLVQQGFVDTGIDLVYDAVDELLRGGRFALCDSILTEARVAEHSADILLAMLTATLPAGSRLASRKRFFSQVEQVLRERGELESGLLSGLEG